jgi:putative hydrolase of the HAD superfamily
MPYKDLFFDLDHTIWDFELNSKETLWELHLKYELEAKGIHDFDAFYSNYSVHNHRLWDRYTKGYIKQEELRWKRIYLSLLEYKMNRLTKIGRKNGYNYNKRSSISKKNIFI